MPLDYLTGYADHLSVAPGETIRFMASSNVVTQAEAAIVRTICGDLNPDGPGFKEKVVPTYVSGAVDISEQVSRTGSYVVVPAHTAFAKLESFTVLATIWPTTPTKGCQGLISTWSGYDSDGFALIIDRDGCLALRLSDGNGRHLEVTSGQSLRERVWTFVATSYDAVTGDINLYQEPLSFAAGGNTARHVTASRAPGSALSSVRPLLMAGIEDGKSGDVLTVGHHYNGKLERPRLARHALTRLEIERIRGDVLPASLRSSVVGAWDFAQDVSGETVADISPNGCHGRTVNLPARGMTGSTWQPESANWIQAPEHYSVIHFHDDDLYDAKWQPTASFTVPEGFKSGLYALRLTSDGFEDRIPFVVRPPRDRATAKLAFLAPSATWLAYANLNPVPFDIAELLANRLVVLHQANILIDEHPEWAPSLYDVHSDGSGVCYSSLYRPILNMRPGYVSQFGGVGSSLREFNADTHVIDWLEQSGFDYDVITDEDVHYDGIDLLSRYDVVMTGTHPEYFSTKMWDATKAFTDTGGRLMVMGGNGFYWRIAYHAELPGVIEVRRAGPAIRTWETGPGEDYQSFDVRRGGLWRALGRPPQSIQGTGFVAEGFDISCPYRRQPASCDARAAFIFDGVNEDELIGDFGVQGGGAAGIEIDRADVSLGTPEHALVLATSEGHTEAFRLVNEEISIMIPNVLGPTNDRIGADMVFFETPGGGAVFTTGSIAWAGSLSHNGYDNNVSRITGNVLKRFLSPEPFEAR